MVDWSSARELFFNNLRAGPRTLGYDRPKGSNMWTFTQFKVGLGGTFAENPLKMSLIRREPDQVGIAVQPRRWVVERFLAWISRNCRLNAEATIESRNRLPLRASIARADRAVVVQGRACGAILLAESRSPLQK